jgi:hypothetical protein
MKKGITLLLVLTAITAFTTSATFAGPLNSVAPRESGYEMLPIAAAGDESPATHAIFDNDANTGAPVRLPGPPITAVPEPTTIAMMVLGASMLAGAQRFRRKRR